MLVGEFLTKLNLLAKYAPRVANLDRGKLDVFIEELRLDINKDAMMGDNPPKNFLEALG